MKHRVPVPREQRPPLPDFAPVPRKYRHDGWTPERQRAFIEALADTGCVSRAAAMVNMSPEGAYYLRRQKGAEEFRRAWEAALDYGVARMKDIAFERVITGYLVPCFVGGKLIGWRRKYNDRLLMFCLRHYGEDAQGRRTTINYFSTRASAGAASAPSARPQQRSSTRACTRDASPVRPACLPAGEDTFDVPDSLRDGTTSLAAAETSVTSVRTTMRETGRRSLDSTATLIDEFAGVELDEAAQAEIYRVLQDCAARRRAVLGTPDDPDERFIAVEQPERDELVYDPGYSRPRQVRRRPPPAGDVVVEAGAFLEQSPKLEVDDPFHSNADEMPWHILDDEEQCAEIEQAVDRVKRVKSAERNEQSGTDTKVARETRAQIGRRVGVAEPVRRHEVSASDPQGRESERK